MNTLRKVPSIEYQTGHLGTGKASGVAQAPAGYVHTRRPSNPLSTASEHANTTRVSGDVRNHVTSQLGDQNRDNGRLDTSQPENRTFRRNYKGNGRRASIPKPAYVEDTQMAGLHQQPRDGGRQIGIQSQHQAPQGFRRCANIGLNSGYQPCDCDDCGRRNRSVYVRVQKGPWNKSPAFQSELREGLGAHFGAVEEVNPVSPKGGTYIVRFRNEQSTLDALKAARDIMPTSKINVSIAPWNRTKWNSNFAEERPDALPLQLARVNDINTAIPSHQGLPPLPSAFPQSFPSVGQFLTQASAPPAPAMPPAHSFNPYAPATIPPRQQAISHAQFHYRRGPAVPLYHSNCDPRRQAATQSQYTPPTYLDAADHPAIGVNTDFHPGLQYQIGLNPLVEQEPHHFLTGRPSPHATPMETEPWSKPTNEDFPSSSKGEDTPDSEQADEEESKRVVLQIACATEETEQNDNTVLDSKAKSPSETQTPSTASIEGNHANIKEEDAKTTKLPIEGEKSSELPVQPGTPKQPSIANTETSMDGIGANDTRKHQRVPSIYSKEEVKDRKKAWARIPMPLTSQRSKESKVDTHMNLADSHAPIKPSPISAPSSDAAQEASIGPETVEKPSSHVARVDERKAVAHQSEAPSKATERDNPSQEARGKETSSAGKVPKNDVPPAQNLLSEQQVASDGRSKNDKQPARSIQLKDNSRPESPIEPVKNDKSGRGSPEQTHGSVSALDSLESSGVLVPANVGNQVPEKQQGGTIKKKSKKKKKKSQPAAGDEVGNDPEARTATPVSTIGRSKGVGVASDGLATPPVNSDQTADVDVSAHIETLRLIPGRPLPIPPIRKRASPEDVLPQPSDDYSGEGSATVRLPDYSDGKGSSLKFPKRGKKGGPSITYKRNGELAGSESLPQDLVDGSFAATLPAHIRQSVAEQDGQGTVRKSPSKRGSIKRLLETFTPPDSHKGAPSYDNSNDTKPRDKAMGNFTKYTDGARETPSAATASGYSAESQRRPKTGRSPVKTEAPSSSPSKAEQEKLSLNDHEWPSLSASHQRVPATPSPKHTWRSKSKPDVN
ncbi:hypothetical protein B0I35DRAFT_257848 [Stachybotrys elegans]|uniref:RRM domain-containing protein n=1 Tax=Stachybotrys elegans TaxID=80388 RepID=A0A8K0ST87_9HYPO|nr:hypothetical protein B0I35DRAFT_257848 [Stachybotrys elegans]